MNKQKTLICTIGISLFSLNTSSGVKASEALLEIKNANLRPIMRNLPFGDSCLHRPVTRISLSSLFNVSYKTSTKRSYSSNLNFESFEDNLDSESLEDSLVILRDNCANSSSNIYQPLGEKVYIYYNNANSINDMVNKGQNISEIISSPFIHKLMDQGNYISRVINKLIEEGSPKESDLKKIYNRVHKIARQLEAKLKNSSHFLSINLSNKGLLTTKEAAYIK